MRPAETARPVRLRRRVRDRLGRSCRLPSTTPTTPPPSRWPPSSRSTPDHAPQRHLRVNRGARPPGRIRSVPRQPPRWPCWGLRSAASSLLGLEGTQQPVVNESSTTTSGDSTATVNVSGQGVATSSGSRVWATFTFDLSGTVTNNTTGATATMTGSATSYIEIDGCPDASGSQQGQGDPVVEGERVKRCRLDARS